jgi:hypothetical protein
VLPPLILLILLVQATPAIVFVDGTLIYGAVAASVALALGAVAIGVRSGEAAHLLKVLRPAALLLMLPAAWMLFQLVPMPLAWSHPIWTSAAEGMGGLAFGHISIDLGATAIAVIRYLTVVGIVVVATAVSIDRTYAEWLLRWLTAATILLASMLMAHTVVGQFALVATATLTSLIAASALGVVIATASVIRSIERYETRRNRADVTPVKFAWSLTMGLSTFALCWVALVIAAPSAVTFSAACGFAVVALVLIIRRFNLAPIAALALAAVAVIVAIAAVINRPNSGGGLTLRFASEASASTSSMIEHIMSDNGVGSGAGTFKALQPIYGGLDPTTLERAPTTAAQVAIEMGHPAVWIAVLMAMACAGLLIRGALRRGRDSFYATAAAGGVVTLTLEAFVDASLFETAVVILATAFLGLGLAQSASRSIH